MDDETFGVAQAALESSITTLDGEITDVKDQITQESTRLKNYKRDNPNMPVYNCNALELLKRTLAIKKSQRKKLRADKLKLESDGILPEIPKRAKKSTDREKIIKLKNLQKQLNEENKQMKKVMEKMEKLKNEKIRKLEDVIKEKNMNIASLKNELKVQGWESKFLCEKLNKYEKRNSMPTDIELQAYINKTTAVGTKRSITFN